MLQLSVVVQVHFRLHPHMHHLLDSMRLVVLRAVLFINVQS
jgi:hypothetical protein